MVIAMAHSAAAVRTARKVPCANTQVDADGRQSVHDHTDSGIVPRMAKATPAAASNTGSQLPTPRAGGSPGSATSRASGVLGSGAVIGGGAYRSDVARR